VQLNNTVYARSTRRPSICARRCPLGAPFRSTKTAVELHTRFGLCGNIRLSCICDDELHDVNILDQSFPTLAPSSLRAKRRLRFERLQRRATIAARA
jgi:hypothetical protein